MLELTINGKKVNASKGETVLEVCRREGIHIPTLCYQENLTPYGGCRLCVVEVAGNSRPMTACTLPVQDGMVIKTDTPMLKELRKFTLQLILSEHPYSCLVCEKTKECADYMECIEKEPITFGCKYCPKDGDCELQKLVEEFGIKDLPFPFRYRNIPLEDYDPFFERDYNLCILCGRCVRACAELRQAYVIDFHHRGPKTLVGTAFNLPHIDAYCQFCGACVDACPTGAMRERYSKHFEKGEKRVKTYCALCSMGCSINAEVKGDKVIRVVPDSEPLCVRGRFGIAPLVNHPRRITSPLLKRDGRIVEVSWEEAVDYAAKTLKEYQGKTGIIFSPDLTIETINSLHTVAEIMGVEEFGAEVSITSSFDEVCLDKKERKIGLVVLNTDLIEDFSVFLLRLKKFLNEKPVIITIDPVRTRIAEQSDLWLRVQTGKEWELLNLLVSSQAPEDFAGVKKQNIIEARRLLVHKEVCVLYNAHNLQNNHEKCNLKCFPLISSLNYGFLTKANLPGADDIINNKDIKCLYLIGASIPETMKYERVIVQDCFLPDFDFDLFLPASTFLETEGSFVDITGKEKRLQKVIEPMGNSLPDEWIIKHITELIDFEMAKKDETPYLRKKAEVQKVVLDSNHPFYLMVRENGYRFRNRTLSDMLKGFKRIHPDRYLWINPADATKLKIENGAVVKVIATDFECQVQVFITDRVQLGMVLAYYNPGKGMIKEAAVRIEIIEGAKKGKQG